MYRWILLTGTEKKQHLKKYCWILLTGTEKDQKKQDFQGNSRSSDGCIVGFC